MKLASTWKLPEGNLAARSDGSFFGKWSERDCGQSFTVPKNVRERIIPL